MPDQKMTNEKSETCFYIRSVYGIFTLIWLLIIVINKFYTELTCYVLFIPFLIFLLAFMNAEDICDSEVENDVLGINFLTIGIVLFIPLVTLTNKETSVTAKTNVNHSIFLAVTCILLSYYHVWVCKSNRHVYKAIRSCLETIAITLYIFAIAIFFTTE